MVDEKTARRDTRSLQRVVLAIAQEYFAISSLDYSDIANALTEVLLAFLAATLKDDVDDAEAEQLMRDVGVELSKRIGEYRAEYRAKSQPGNGKGAVPHG